MHIRLSNRVISLLCPNNRWIIGQIIHFLVFSVYGARRIKMKYRIAPKINCSCCYVRTFEEFCYGNETFQSLTIQCSTPDNFIPIEPVSQLKLNWYAEYWSRHISLQHVFNYTKHMQNSAQLQNIKFVPCRTDGRLLLSGFQALMTLTLTLTLDRVIRHTVVHHSSSSIYTSNFIKIKLKKLFVDGLSAGTPPSSRSRDTKSRINIKNPAKLNLDIVL